MFNWKKLGKLFDPTQVTGKSWLYEFAQAPSVLLFDDFIRVYFSCRPQPDQQGRYVSYSAFVDLDRKNMFHIRRIADQPILTLGERGCFDEFGTYPASVIRNNEEIRVYYGGWTRCESVPFDVAIGLAISNNKGETFIKKGPGPVLSSSINEPFIISGPKIRRFNDKWYLFYIAGQKWIIHEGRPEPVYRIRMAVSDDGISWNKIDRNLVNCKLEENEAQASPDVFFYNGYYHMFFSYRYSTGFRGREKGYRIGYAYSTDLLHWERDDMKAGIDVSDSGWDDEMISYPNVVEIDGDMYMFYLGNQVGRYGFGVARLQ